MDTLILVLFGVTILAALIVLIGRMLVRQREAREHAERTGEPLERPRTPEEQARDRQTAMIWGCIVVALPLLLIGAYVLTR
ncbi:hypothetical protein CJ197_08545 [Brachybacterium sp. UMB0905]|nr:hypothetical protein CJ197_08545 [Brachybacterium sp. UMB0905]